MTSSRKRDRFKDFLSGKKTKKDRTDASRARTPVSDVPSSAGEESHALAPSIYMLPQATPPSSRRDNLPSHPVVILEDQVLSTTPVSPPSRVRIVEERLNSLRNPGLMDDAVYPMADDWVLDADFITTLEIWNLDHPNDTLVHVLKRVNSAIQKHQPFIDLIPDTPFPAKTVVKSLAQLLDLGEKLSGANFKALEFALDIAEWFSNLHLLTQTLENGDQRKLVWKDLSGFRKILDEICAWAVTRLNDNRWSPGSRFDVEDEITEFKMRFSEARQIFQDHSLIRLLGGVRGVSQSIQAFSDGQDKLRDILQKIEAARKAEEEKFAAERARQQYLQRTLDPRTATTPTYDQQEKMPCDNGTRVEVLADIRRWIHDHSDMSQNFLWLTGNPGCGKSAITATIAQEGKDLKYLWAQFFINRNLDDTTNPNKYFPTIARQLSDYSELVEHHIHDKVKERPSVVDRMNSRQAAELFISAIAKASALNQKEPVLIVIDGLDETDPSCLRDTATIFSCLFKDLSDHPNAKILISSRTEDKIYKPFTEVLTNRHVKRLHLDTDTSRGDVGRFLKERLRIIAENRGLHTNWPGDEYIGRLKESAAGLFIWAVTFIRFLDTQLDLRGQKDLDNVLENMEPVPGKEDIYSLYGRILQVTHDSLGAKDWDFEIFRRLVGTILVSREPLNVSHLDELLDLSFAPPGKSIDVENFVRRLRTVLVSGMDTVDGTTVLRVHKTFFEYVTGKNSEERFRVDLETANAEITLACLYHLAASYIAVQSSQFALGPSEIKPLSYSTRYALRFCLSHVPRRHGRKMGIVFDNMSVTLPQFNSLLSHCSSISSNSGPLHIQFNLGSPLVLTSLQTYSLVWNMVDGLPTTPVNLPLQHPLSKVVFSLDGSHLASIRIGGRIIALWDIPAFKCVEEINVSEATAISFSPDSTLLASGCDDGTIETWNYNRKQSWEAHEEMVLCVSFSPDGGYLVSGSSDYTIKIWNVHTGTLAERQRMEHEDWVRSVTISTDGIWILSSSSDRTLRLWDFCSGKQIGNPLVGHSATVICAAISPKLDYFVSGSWDATVRLWDTKTQRQLGHPWTGHVAYAVDYIEFMRDGTHIISSGYDGVRLWSVPNGEALAFFNPFHTAHHSSPRAFSPEEQQIVYKDGESLAIANISSHFFHTKSAFEAQWSGLSIPNGNIAISVGSNNNLLLWNLNSSRVIGHPLRGNTHEICCAAFSPNEKLVAGASTAGTIYLWDTGDYSLIGTYEHRLTNTNKSLSLSFAPDGKAIEVKVGERMNSISLKPSHCHQIIPKTQNLLLQDSFSTMPTQSSVHLYNSQSRPNHRLEETQWFYGDSETVLWALVNNYVIRAGANGKFVIVPIDH